MSANQILSLCFQAAKRLSLSLSLRAKANNPLASILQASVTKITEPELQFRMRRARYRNLVAFDLFDLIEIIV